MVNQVNFSGDKKSSQGKETRKVMQGNPWGNQNPFWPSWPMMFPLGMGINNNMFANMFAPPVDTTHFTNKGGAGDGPKDQKKDGPGFGTGILAGIASMLGLNAVLMLLSRKFPALRMVPKK